MTGIPPGVIEELSGRRGEPQWMTQLRRRGLDAFEEQSPVEPLVADVDLADVERPDLPAAGARHDAEIVRRRRREALAARGILFCDMGTALRDHPDLVERHVGAVVTPDDNPYAALNAALWSGGSFVHVPPGVECELPLEVDLAVDADHAGRFRRSLVVVGEGSRVHYIDGCSAPMYTSHPVHAPVVEIVVGPDARVAYTSIQNWSPNVDHIATKRARVETGGRLQWIEGNFGSKLTATCPSVRLVGAGAACDVLSVAAAGAGQHRDAGGEIVHAAPDTTSRIVSKSIGHDGGSATHRSSIRVSEGASRCTSSVRADALLLDDDSVSTSVPHTEMGEPDAEVEHAESVSTIADEQVFYLQSRGLSEARARAVLVNGFIEPVTRLLPVEYAVEWSRLVELRLNGAVG